jgi:hypothetical protein
MSKNRPGRGGYRQPANPAPVATPNRNRTDGGPGNKKQPLRRLPNAAYGENKAFMEAQQSVGGLPAVKPIPVNSNTNSIQNTLFGPTERPMQSDTAGGILDFNSDGLVDEMVQDDVDVLLDEMSLRNPNNLILQQLKSTRETQKYYPR